jgi:hypothetical protein
MSMGVVKTIFSEDFRLLFFIVDSLVPSHRPRANEFEGNEESGDDTI